MMPSTVRVGPYDIRLVEWDTVDALAHDQYGEFSNTTLTVKVAIAGVHPHQALTTVMHELMHAAWWANNIKEDEESVVTHMSLAMLQVIRDNPKFMAWVGEMLEAGESYGL